MGAKGQIPHNPNTIMVNKMMSSTTAKPAPCQLICGASIKRIEAVDCDDWMRNGLY